MQFKKLLILFSLLSLFQTTVYADESQEIPLVEVLNGLEQNDYDYSAFFESDQINEKAGLRDSIVIPVSELSRSKMLIALGITGVIIAFDEQIMDFVQDRKGDTTAMLAEFGDHMGSDYLAPLVIGTYALGFIFKDTKMKETAIEAVESALLGQIVVETVKSLSHRARPNDDLGAYAFDGPSWGSDNTSFVSGHSAGAWSVATIYAKKYSDSKIIPAVAYSIATLVSLSRVHDNKHWFSDAALGALVGYTSAIVVYNYNDKRRKRNISASVEMREGYGGFKISIPLRRSR